MSIQPLTQPIGFVPTNPSASGEPPHLSQPLIAQHPGDSALKRQYRATNQSL
jgi:hypothetical protein